MQELVTYFDPSSSSSIRSFSDLGITFNDTGQMSFSTSTFNALSDNQISDAFKFLGSANSGFAALASNFTQLTDPVSGLIETQINGYQTENTDLGNEITTAQAQAAQIQASATSQAESADALVAELQSQQNVWMLPSKASITCCMEDKWARTGSSDYSKRRGYSKREG